MKHGGSIWSGMFLDGEHQNGRRQEAWTPSREDGESDEGSWCERREEEKRRGEKGRKGRGEEEAEAPMVLIEAADWLRPPEEEEERLVRTVTDTFLFMTLR